MSLRRLSLGFVALAVLAASAAADPIVLGTSGWSVEFLGSRATGTATVVGYGEGLVKISIDKDFGEAVWEGDAWDFPVAQLSFTQTGPNPVGRIVIDHEYIANNTGLPWTEFRWSIFQGGTASFNAGASAGWTVTPLAGWVAQTPSGAGHLSIVASGGTPVASGAAFYPSGGLVIDASGDFALKQTGVPEPSAAAVILVGLLAIRMRRRRRR